MNLEKMLKDAYMSGVTEAQVAEQIPNMKFDFEGMANAYAQSKVKELNIPDVSDILPDYMEWWYNLGDHQIEDIILKSGVKKPISDKDIESLHRSYR